MNGWSLTARIPDVQRRLSLLLLIGGICVAWKIGDWIAAQDLKAVMYAGMGAFICGIGLVILKNWRSGLYLFLIWLLFEDLVRKYMGNNMLIYFAKDALVAMIYVSFFVALRRHRQALFRFPFVPLLGLFVWLGLMECFNPGSPSLFYGFLGLRLYFYYIPLMFVGYTLIRTDYDLRHFLLLSVSVAGVIALLGIMQSIRGPSFLNPRVLSPYLEDVSTLRRYAPVTGASLYQPNSVFVSAGRFDMYLDFAWLLALGTGGYVLLSRYRGQWIVYPCLGMIAVAAVMCGGRGAFAYVLGSAIILPAAFLWGASLHGTQSNRLLRMIRRLVVIGAISFVAIIVIFPREIEARWSYYTETMLPNSPNEQLTGRGSYTLNEFKKAFQQGGWVFGHGIGTASSGVQYISGVLGQNRPDFGVESGFGNIVLEFGIFGLALWWCWTAALLIYSWKVVLSLRRTPYFPLAFAIVWFAFLILYPITSGTLVGFQDYIYSAYLWLLIGILYRLPSLASAGVERPKLESQPVHEC